MPHFLSRLRLAGYVIYLVVVFFFNVTFLAFLIAEIIYFHRRKITKCPKMRRPHQLSLHVFFALSQRVCLGQYTFPVHADDSPLLVCVVEEDISRDLGR